MILSDSELAKYSVTRFSATAELLVLRIVVHEWC